MTHHALKYIKTFLPLCIFASSGMLLSIQNVAGAPSLQMPSNSAQSPVMGLYDALKAAQKTGTTASQRVAIITPAVEQAFDMKVILRRSIGLHYDKLSADEHQKLLSAFRNFTVARYASTFKPGTNAVFMIDPNIQTSTNGSFIVKTSLRGSNDTDANATPLDYIVHKTANGWRITDILLNGQISQVAAQRSDFKTIFEQSGATGLARTLNHKADDSLHE